MVISKTPYRISFFGGGTDYPAWYREHGGAVLATTIDRYSRLNLRYLLPFFKYKHRIVCSTIETVQEIKEIKHPAVRAVMEFLKWERGIDILYDGDLPAWSGMGSSSAFIVGLLNSLTTLRGVPLIKGQLAERAIYIEQEVLKENVGSQDQIVTTFGGFNCIRFGRDGTYQITPVVVPQARLKELEESLILVFTGILRRASDIASSQLDALQQHEGVLHRIHHMVEEGISILQNPQCPLVEFGSLLGEAWECKRKLSKFVSSTRIDEIYEAGRSSGAVGGKLLGAGGGGFMLFFVPPEKRRLLREKLKDLVLLSFRFERDGSQITFYQDDVGFEEAA